MLKEEKEFFLASEFGKEINDKYLCKLSVRGLSEEDYKVIISHAINDADPYKHTDIYTLKDEIIKLLLSSEYRLPNLIKKHSNQDDFDNWFKTMISDIGTNIPKMKDYTTGQKQKLINMILKYLFCFADEEECNCFEFCHMPLDSYIYEDWFKNDVMQYCKSNDKDNFRYKKDLPGCWSKIESIDTYLWIQKTINNFITKESKSLFGQKLTPLQAEFYLWPFLKCRRAKHELEKQYNKYYDLCHDSIKKELLIFY